MRRTLRDIVVMSCFLWLIITLLGTFGQGGRRRPADYERMQQAIRGVLPSGSIGSAEIEDGSVASADIASGTIETGDIKDGTIASADIADGTVAPGDATTALKTKTSITQITLAQADQQKYVFVAPYACTISQISLVSDTATTSDAGTTNWTFQIANLTQTNDLLSSAYVGTNSAGLAADTVLDLSPNTNLTLTANDVLEFQATANNTPTDLTGAEIITVVEYY